MKIDWDLVRSILLTVEEAPAEFVSMRYLNDKLTAEKSIVEWHVRLLDKEYLNVERKSLSTIYLPGASPSRTADTEADRIQISLTLAGHQFIKSISDDSIWSEVKAVARSKSVELTFDLIAYIVLTVFSVRSAIT
jgi:hypothetical protein